MFCYQCEQHREGQCDDAVGVCGKDAETSDLQDLLMHGVKGISRYAAAARENGADDIEIDRFVIDALFTTVTNVNFDPDRLIGLLQQAGQMLEKSKALYEQAAGPNAPALNGATTWRPAADRDGLLQQAKAVSILSRRQDLGDDAAGLQELIAYGLKGTAAYVDHASILGQEDPQIYADIEAGMAFLDEQNPSVDDLLGWALKAGEINLRVMELLDRANTGAYGHPQPTAVRVTPVKGKCIVVSGHDLKDLKDLLEQTKDKGINVYTHGEMLPALAYPELKKYPHLVGNYGGAWQRQVGEFKRFPGAVLMTTNCIQKPNDDYMDRIFTSGLVAWPGVTHITDGDFTPVIEAALAAPGFAEDEEEKLITVGFGHNAVLGVADKVINAVKGGDIRHFFLIGGCDGARPGRNYYTELAESVPDDCVILTLACGKFRFNKLEFGDIGGIPRLLDMGQCNDAYSAIKVAVALAEAFDCGVNDLPLSMVLSWYEQKACAILLTLLHLGVQDIRLGPTLPAFVTPPVLNVLVDKFGLKPTTAAKADLEAILN